MKALIAIAALVLLLPFEPMEPIAAIAGFQLSHLELAGLVLLVTALVSLGSWNLQVLHVPLWAPALALLLAYALSTAFAGENALLPLKFTLRMAAGIVALVLTSRALAAAPRFDVLFAAFALAGATTAAIALLEAGSSSAVEAFVAPFREHSFEVGGRARVAATFSYPNTAGGFLALTLPAAMSFLLRRESSPLRLAVSFVASLAIFLAILLTYSRGALLGAAAAAICLFLLSRRAAKSESSRLVGLQTAFVVVALGLLVVEPSFRWRASSEGDKSWYLAEITPESEELALAPGILTETVVTVKNVGKLTWGSTGARPFHLSYRWFRPRSGDAVEPVAIEGERTPLASPVVPGEELEMRATVRAPSEPGSYVLLWDMVHEHTTWFSDKLGLGAPVRVVVGDRGAEALPRTDEIRRRLKESAWRPGRWELWGLALELFRAHPLLGVGPDNFRWLYGPLAGRDSWDRRVYSNSLYLELLATVGLVGLGAFSVLVGGALLALGRRVVVAKSLDAAILAASLVGFLVHGFFDYLLAFTPMYLAFFILLGAASAAVRERGPA